MKNFTSLEDLNLRNNVFSSLSPFFYNFVNLKTLNLENNFFSTLPKEFGNLKSLEVLKLGFNQFESVPVVIFQLKQLKVLSLTGNFIVGVRGEIETMENITDLDLSFNQIMILPSLERMKSLKKLNINNNPLFESCSSLLRRIKERSQKEEKEMIKDVIKEETKEETKEEVIKKEVKEEKVEIKEIKTDSKNIQRGYAITEILESEKKYVGYLHYIRDYYLSFQNGEVHKQTKISNDILSTLLPDGFEDVLKFNEELIQELKKVIDLENKSKLNDVLIGQIFIDRAPYMKLYINFISVFQECTSRIKSLMDEYPLLKEYIEKKSLEPESEGLLLNSYLIMPIQRIPRYALLLRAVLEYTNPSHPDYENLKVAQQKVEEVSSYINQKIDEMISKNTAQQLTKELGLEFNSKRLFFKEGEISEISGNAYVCYLFNDLIILKKSTYFGFLNQETICKVDECNIKIEKEKKQVFLKYQSFEFTFIQCQTWLKHFEKLIQK